MNLSLGQEPAFGQERSRRSDKLPLAIVQSRPLHRGSLMDVGVEGARPGNPVDPPERLPVDGPAILCPNHISFLDSAFLLLTVPRNISFVGKAEYLDSWKTRYLFPAIAAVSLALSGTGKGWDIGVAFGSFIILFALSSFFPLSLVFLFFGFIFSIPITTTQSIGFTANLTLELYDQNDVLLASDGFLTFTLCLTSKPGDSLFIQRIIELVNSLNQALNITMLKCWSDKQAALSGRKEDAGGLALLCGLDAGLRLAETNGLGFDSAVGGPILFISRSARGT